jgi:hypothetical protein
MMYWTLYNDNGPASHMRRNAVPRSRTRFCGSVDRRSGGKQAKQGEQRNGVLFRPIMLSGLVRTKAVVVGFLES